MSQFIQITADRPYVVYLHRCGDELIYVGSGTFARSLEWAKRPPAYEQARAGRDVTVEIFNSYTTREQAYDAEEVFIVSLCPPGNTLGKDAAVLDRREMPRGRPAAEAPMRTKVQVWPSGAIFDSVRDAAAATGVSVGSVSWSLKYGQMKTKKWRFDPIVIQTE